MTDYEAANVAALRQELPLTINHDTGDDDYTGINHTTVNRCESLSGISVNGDAEVILDSQIGGAGRFKGTCMKVTFKTTGDYVEIDLGAQDWTAGNAEDDDLTFFMWALATFANTEFDLELRNNAGTLITSADFAVPAYSTARKPQFVDIDTSTPTLSDVRYIRIIFDGTEQKQLWIWDFVRTDADCLDKAEIIDMEALYENTAGLIQINDANNTGTNGHFHRNSLAESGEEVTSTMEEFKSERIGWMIFHGVGTDTTVSLNLMSRSR